MQVSGTGGDERGKGRRVEGWIWHVGAVGRLFLKKLIKKLTNWKNYTILFRFARVGAGEIQGEIK